MLKRIAPFLSRPKLLNICKQTILPVFDYGCIVWGVCGKSNLRRLERLQNQAMRIILAANRRTCSQDKRNRLSLLSLDSRWRFLKLLLAFNIVHNVNCPHQLQGYFIKRSELHGRILKDSTLLNFILAKTKMDQSTFKCDAVREWNGLPREIRELNALSKTRIFNHFI